MNNVLPATELLKKQGVKLDTVCQRCGNREESVNHILFTCSVARQVWALANIPSPDLFGFNDSQYRTLIFLMGMKGMLNIPIEIKRGYTWFIWVFMEKNRNGVCFEGKNSSSMEIYWPEQGRSRILVHGKF